MAVFVVFVAAQATVMFGGHDYLQRTTGLTYAEYVHQGFGQLDRRDGADPDRRGRRTARKAGRGRRVTGCCCAARSGALCVMTLVVVVSALYRMHVYEEAYGFTRLRLLVIGLRGLARAAWWCW